MATRNHWTKEELILAFNLYWEIPFGKMHNSNPKIVHLANLIGRTPSSIALRLVNFASIDPVLQARGIKGMQGGTNIVKPIWDEYFANREDLIYLSEQILAKKEDTSIEKKYKELIQDIGDLKGENRERLIKTRVNQSVFRRMVLINYETKCAITGIDIPELLVASHIVPWSKSEKNRLNPENGICLSPLYDKAFDKGFISINKDYEIIISKKLKDKFAKDYYINNFALYENRKISEALNYLPRPEFLSYHFNEIFNK
jgi:putative restriction endonuclease